MIKKLVFFVLATSILLVGCSGNNTDVNEEIKNLSTEIENLNTIIADQQQLISQLEEETIEDTIELEIKNRKLHIQEYIDDLDKPIKFDNEDPIGMYYYSNDKVLDGSYSVDKGIEAFYRVRTFLRSFEKLTEKTKKYLSREEIEEIGNLDGETQTLGLANIPLNVVGGLYDQNYIIKKLDLELAIKRYQHVEIDREELDRKREGYLLAKKQYEEFIEGARYGD